MKLGKFLLRLLIIIHYKIQNFTIKKDIRVLIPDISTKSPADNLSIEDNLKPKHNTKKQPAVCTEEWREVQGFRREIHVHCRKVSSCLYSFSAGQLPSVPGGIPALQGKTRERIPKLYTKNHTYFYWDWNYCKREKISNSSQAKKCIC